MTKELELIGRLLAEADLLVKIKGRAEQASDVLLLREAAATLAKTQEGVVVDGAPSECRECGSSSLSWFAANKNRTGVAEGRLRTDDVRCIFVLGCDECSETLFTISADAAANLLTTPQAAPVPVEGDNGTLGQLLTLLGWHGVQVGGGTQGYPWTIKLPDWCRAAPPEQPAIDLERHRYPTPYQEGYSDDGGDTWLESPDDAAFVNGLAVGDTYELQVCHYSVSRTYRVTKAPDEESDDYEVEPVALIDGAKAGKGEGHG